MKIPATSSSSWASTNWSRPAAASSSAASPKARPDIYPRLGPTCEWDTGAAHAVLVAAGGKVTQLDGTPLAYGKEEVLNPYFVASGAWYNA